MAERSTYWGRMGRRSLLRGALAGSGGLIGAALIGCGTSKPASPAGGSSAAPGAAAPAGETPIVSESFVAAQTRDITALDPMELVYTVGERVGLVYPRLVNTELASNDPADIKFSPSYITEGFEMQGSQLTMKLRKGVKYSNIAPLNGREFVADDVKFSINRYANDPKSIFKAQYTDITSIETPDKYTVVFKLKGPTRYLITQLAAISALISPPETVAEYKTKAIGPGPYIHEEMLQGEGSKLRKNPDFVDAKKIYYNRYLFKVLTDTATRLAAMKAGQVDFGLGGLSPSDMKAMDGANVSSYPMLSVSTSNITWNSRNPKWKDYRARLAMSKALDRQAIIDVTLQKAGVWTGSVPVDFGKWALSESEVKEINAFKYDPAEAKKLWEAAGRPGMANELYFSSNGTVGANQAELFSKQWEQNLGIKTTLKTEDYSIYLTKAYTNKYEDMNTTSYGVPNWMDHLFEAYLPGGSRNGAGLNDKKVTGMLGELRSTMDDKAAVEKSKTIQRYIADNVLSMTQLPTAVTKGVFNANLRNFKPGLYAPGMEWMLGSWKAK